MPTLAYAQCDKVAEVFGTPICQSELAPSTNELYFPKPKDDVEKINREKQRLGSKIKKLLLAIYRYNNANLTKLNKYLKVYTKPLATDTKMLLQIKNSKNKMRQEQGGCGAYRCFRRFL